MVVDVDWRLERAHRSLGPKPPAGARPRDVIVRFHFYDSKEALTLAMRNMSQIAYKGAKIQIFCYLSPITLSKWRILHLITAQLQYHGSHTTGDFPSVSLFPERESNTVSEISKKGKPSSKAWTSLLCLKKTCFPPSHQVVQYLLPPAVSGPLPRVSRKSLSPHPNSLHSPSNLLDVTGMNPCSFLFFSRLLTIVVWTPV